MKTFRSIAALAVLATANAQRSDHTHTNVEITNMVAELNKAREVVGSCPIEWDANLAVEAAKQDNVVSCQGNPDWASQDKDGLLIQSAYLRGDLITPAKWLEFPISSKAYWDLETVPQTAAKEDWFRWTSIVWKDVTKVGCHSCHYINKFYNDFITFCKFDATTNVDNMFVAKVGNDGDVCDLCAKNAVDCSHLATECTASVCTPATGACVENNKASTTSCTDNSPHIVAGSGRCVNGECKGTTLCTGVTCTSPGPCFLPGTCDPATGQCSDATLLELLICDDGNPNTHDDRCRFGSPSCRGISLCDGVVCSGALPCKAASTCDPTSGACIDGSDFGNGTPCDDGDSSTTSDSCTNGACAGVNLCAGVSCLASNDCHNDGVCDPASGSCILNPKSNGSPCDDGDSSTTSDSCTNGACAGVNLCAGVSCLASNDCHNDGVCDPASGSCILNPKSNGSPCDDGDSSTTTDSCTNGACAGVNLCAGVSCPAHTNCHNDGVCDPASGSCILNPKSNGSPCDDGDSSTTTDSCTNGACAGVNLCAGVSCPALNDCHNDGVCDPASGTCTPAPKSDGTPCDDMDVMTTSDVCESAVCKGTPCTSAPVVMYNGVPKTGVAVSGGGQLPIGGIDSRISRPVKEFLEGTTYHNVGGSLSGGVLKLSCPLCATDGCRFYVAVYHCPPASSNLNGGLPQTLPSLGWEARSCGPDFYPNGIQESQRTLIFKKDVAAGKAVDVVLDRDAPYMGVFTDNLPLADDWCQAGTGSFQGPSKPRVCLPINSP